jgi:hypothetical protein
VGIYVGYCGMVQAWSGLETRKGIDDITQRMSDPQHGQSRRLEREIRACAYDLPCQRQAREKQLSNEGRGVIELEVVIVQVEPEVHTEHSARGWARANERREEPCVQAG